MHTDFLTGFAIIAVLGVGAQWIAWRFRLPSILLLLILGFAVGNLPPNDPLIDPELLLGDLRFPVVSLAVAIILFEGGLSLRFAEFREVGRTVFSLVIVGALATWVIAAFAAIMLLQLDTGIAILLGAILVVTGPTVIAPLLEHIKPSRPSGPILKWEGIVIDPIGAMLTVLVFEALLEGRLAEGVTVALAGVLRTIVVAGLIGIGAAGILTLLLRRALIPDALQNPVALAFVVVAFAMSNHFQEESGLFAAPLMGLILANRKKLVVRHIVEFEENLRVLLLAFLFIVLGAGVSMDRLTTLGLSSFLFLAVLILVARPVAVALATARSKLGWQERVFLAWMAPRGVVAAAVASIYAFRLEETGRFSDIAVRTLVPVTFLVIVGTVAVYGLTAKPLADRIGVSKKSRGLLIIGAYAWSRQIARALQNAGQQVLLVDTNRANLNAARMEGIPTYHADALSHEALDHIDIEGVGRVLAMTSNEEFNSLATLHFLEAFDRNSVYQLAPSEKKKEDGDPATEGALSHHLRGRLLFSAEMNFERLTVRFAAGWQLRTTPITDRFTYERFRERYGRSAVPLFLIRADNDLEIYSTDHRPEPQPGQTLISLVEPGYLDDVGSGERAEAFRPT